MNRRTFGKSVVGGAFAAALPGIPREAEREGYITDIATIKVGHFTDTRRPTGCTVVLCENGAVTAVEVRGSAPGTRETDLLDPVNTVEKANAILLSGGSAFGLDAATGVMRFLEERNLGYSTAFGKVPIVPAAILYDLGVGDPKIRPDADSGYKACLNAKSGPLDEGSVGAGAGATIGKMGGGNPMKGGIGTASITAGSVIVGAIVAVNCVGNIIDPKTGQIIAGARKKDGTGFVDIIEWYRNSTSVAVGGSGTNTTIGVVATNAAFNKTQMKKIAEMAHDGMARAINPTHTPSDGDTLFAMSTGAATDRPGNVGMVGALAAEAVSQAILRAVMKATSVPGFSSYLDLKK